MFYVYILKSEKDGSYYVGQTDNLKNRIKKHNSGQSKFTKKKLPYQLVYSESFETRGAAMKREKQIKSYKGGAAFKKLVD